MSERRVAGPPFLLWAAVAAPVCYFVTLTAATLAYPGFDEVVQLPSELGARGAPHPMIFNVGMAVSGLVLILAGLGLRTALRRLDASRGVAATAAVLAALSGLYLLAIAAFPLPDPRHDIVAILALAMHPLPFVVAAALGTRPVWRGLRRFLVVAGLALLALLVAVVFAGPESVRAGLLSRLYAAVAFGWMAVAGVILARNWVLGLSSTISFG